MIRKQTEQPSLEARLMLKKNPHFLFVARTRKGSEDKMAYKEVSMRAPIQGWYS